MMLPRKLWRMVRIFIDFKRRAERVHALPLRLWVESASCCNLRCVMCPNKEFQGSDKGVMTLALFKKIVDECRSFASDIYLHHRGEPFLNPALFDMIRYARAAGLKTRFHSNGGIMDETKARKLLEAAPNMVSFSIDGFTKETYEQVRVGGTFETTVENVIRLATLRRELNMKLPYIVIERIRFKHHDIPENRQAIEALTRRFEEAGVDEIIAKDEYVWAEETAPESATARPCAVCTFPWYAMVICWDGTVTPCPQDYKAFMKMGNVQQSSLREIWNGEAYRTLRHQLIHDVSSLALCRKCDRLSRKTVGGVPLQYMITFLTDQFIGYSKLRRWLGTHERNS